MPPTSRRRRLGWVVAGAVVASLIAGPAAAADADARPAALLRDQARAARPVAISALGGVVARTPTRLHGWAASPRSVRAHHRLVVPVRVTGGQRAVRLERRIAGQWRALDRTRSSAAGRATLRWRPKTPKTHVLVRVRVPATTTDAGLRSPAHRVRVVQPATPAPNPTSSPRPSTTPSAAPISSPDEALRARLLVLVNQARSRPRTCGSTQYPAVPALSRSTPLDTAAGDFAARMASEDFFSHTAPDGSTMVGRLDAVGVRNTAMRENIAAGYSDADAVMAGWLRSDGHCANLMAADVTRIGFGSATSTTAKYSKYWVQDLAG